MIAIPLQIREHKAPSLPRSLCLSLILFCFITLFDLKKKNNPSSCTFSEEEIVLKEVAYENMMEPAKENIAKYLCVWHFVQLSLLLLLLHIYSRDAPCQKDAVTKNQQG